MVVFTCNNCGDSVQKPKVAKHYQFQCRNSISLTCVDCFKDFLGDEYTVHTKCITEAERYGGKNYVAKPSMNKGEKKQQEWINIVNNVVESAPNMSKDERNLLQYISKHENIPRKKVKFMNFVKSVMGYRVNLHVVESVWTQLEKAFKDMSPNSKPHSIPSEKVINNGNNDKKSDIMKHQNGNGNSLEINDEEKSNLDAPPTELKSKKRKLKSDITEEPAEKMKLTDENSITELKKKFDWNSTIAGIVDAKGEISLKKLEKKVVNKYMKQCENSIREKVVLKFQKKLRKLTYLAVIDDKVKRVNEN